MMSQFFDATSDAVLFLNHDFVITFLNRRAEEILEPRGPILGTSLWESFPETALPDSPYWINYHRTLEDGIATHFEAYYGEPLNLWFDIHALPSKDGIILFFRDITRGRANREALEQKTREVEQQLAEIEALYRTAPIGLALFDLDDYHYVRLNDRQAAFFGLKPEEIVGRTLTEMAPIEGLRELFDQVAQGGPPVVNFPLEGALVTDPDNYRYWTVSYFPVTGPDGTIQGITAASLEITQQKKAEQALMESEKLAVVGRLAASIAHEINNPLESVTNLLYLARHSTRIEDVQQFILQAETELQRVAHITSQTLRFHKQASSPQEISGKSLMESIRSIFHGKLLNASAMVEERHRDIPPVRCFEGEIRQVISNLVGNALDAMPPKGGRLLLRSRQARDPHTGAPMLVLTVADNGSGIPKQVLEKIFRPFYTTKGIVGTGLGLWISQEIVNRHNGALRVRSREGKGSVFTIALPYAALNR
jgi:PAS domain S-box-containing protein